MTRRTQKTLTLVVPVLNEVSQIEPFLERIEDTLTNLRMEWRVLFIDDGSTDGSSDEVWRMLGLGWPVHIITLSRNFGKEAALTAGLDWADSDAVVPMDVDLQHPPEIIPDLVAAWEAGADVVLAKRRSRGSEGFFKRASAVVFYSLMNLLSDVPLPHNVGDFRLLDRRVVLALRNMRERTRYMKGILSWPGFREEVVSYDQPDRATGEVRQRLGKLVQLALDGIISFSSAPLRIWALVGAGVSAAAFLYMTWIIVSTLALGHEVPGYASIMTTVLFVGGVQLLSIGILGEYLARVYTEVKRRPIYVIASDGEETRWPTYR